MRYNFDSSWETPISVAHDIDSSKLVQFEFSNPLQDDLDFRVWFYHAYLYDWRFSKSDGWNIRCDVGWLGFNISLNLRATADLTGDVK